MSLADLEAKYPLIYVSCHPRGGPGWLPLLDVLLAQLQARADAGGTQAIALQTREKWGRLALRFKHLDLADEAMLAYVTELSMRICDVCGGPGEHLVGWHRTRCEPHADMQPTWPTSAR